MDRLVDMEDEDIIYLTEGEEAKEVVYRHLVREGKADGKLQRHAIIVVKKQVSYHSPHWLIN